MTLRHCIASAAIAAAVPVWAHEGHGLPGAHHWHAGDAWPLLVAAVVAILLARRKP